MHLIPTSDSSLLRILIITLWIGSAPISTYARDEPTEIQRRAIQRIDRVLEYRRQTGDIQGSLAELQTAAAELASTCTYFESSGSLAPWALSLNKLGEIGRLLNKYREAQSYYQQAYQLAAKAGHAGYQVKALLGLAKVELYRSDTHDYQSAAKYIDEVIHLTTNTANKEDLCDAYELKCELHTELREFPAAAEAIGRAFALAPELPDQMLLFHAYYDRGAMFAQIAANCDYTREVETCSVAVNRARTDYEQSRGIAQKLGYNYAAQAVSLNLRVLDRRMEMITAQQRTNKLFDSSRIFHPRTGGDVLATQQFLPPRTGAGNASSTSQLSEKLAPLLELQVKKTGDSATDYYLRGSLSELNDDYDRALAYFLQAVKILDSDARTLRDEKSLGTFLEDKIQFYYRPMLHLLERQRYNEAFDLMENSRSRAMADLLRSQDIRLARPEDQKLYAQYLKVTADISVKQQELFRARTKPDSEQTRQKIAAAENEIRVLEENYRNFLKSMSATDSNIQVLVAPQTATLQALQRSIKQDRLDVLYYLVLDAQVIIWHVNGDESHVLSVSLPRQELIKKVTSLRESLIAPPRNPAAKFDEQTAREMFLFLVQPVLKWIKTDHLMIIPHEDLNYVPFQVFYDPERNQYVGERFQVTYAPSATVLSRMRKTQSIRGRELLAIADKSIVEGENEVRTLGKLYAGHSKVVIDAHVKESDVKSAMAGYDLIHLSVHGKFDQTEPLLSYLKLNPGGTDDGRLTTAEMFGLPLAKAQLVVLSACETGQAKATRANEVIGMERALLYAGAHNLILSSWEVDAASTELWMETFYREAQSKPLSEATRLATIAVKTKYRHPYYWSPFLLIGK